jgi:hypothetical protein
MGLYINFNYWPNGVPMGHTLWMTSISFILGQFLYSYSLRLPPKAAIAIGGSAMIMMIGLNYGFGIKYFDYFLIQIFSVVFVMFLLVYKLPFFWMRPRYLLNIPLSFCEVQRLAGSR